jgi:hypothetical protein
MSCTSFGDPTESERYLVWCENARTNDGENPEITIPKSEVWTSKCEVQGIWITTKEKCSNPH